MVVSFGFQAKLHMYLHYDWLKCGVPPCALVPALVAAGLLVAIGKAEGHK